ncbi:hypothetical protein IEQ34_016247 [Dendrobium chrysotoxum]|uniref:Uncharacterized protein n=1 Tax=Dendrobium chrysotoxum TaxID=161865 RepID=A0AAV7GFZ5_DENCH|nr:hypothetical protein IEQ34_016247 [Dendrobium chrysotoxum]
MFNPMFDYANLNKWIINFIIKVIIVIDISIRGKKITITINHLNMTIMIVRGLVMHDLMYGAPSEVIWMMTEINELVHCIRQYTESTNYNVNARSLQSKQQSIFASSHLCGFILNESAISSPSKYRLNSGQIAALPAHAASTWNHTPNSLATSPISLNGSTAPTAVVPTVPHKYNGTIPATTSASIAALTLSAVNAYPVSADVDITRKFLAGIPTSFAAF